VGPEKIGNERGEKEVNRESLEGEKIATQSSQHCPRSARNRKKDYGKKK